MSNWKRELRPLVLDARESCAGGSIKPTYIVLRKIGRALSKARFLGVPQTINITLDRAYMMMENVREYKDRIPVDNILCDLLNKELNLDHESS